MDPGLSPEQWIIQSRKGRHDRRIKRQIVKSERQHQDAINQLIGPLESALLRIGFVRVSKSASGSRYLIMPPLSFRLRLSDHDLPPHLAMRHGNLALSVKVEPVRTHSDLRLQAIDIGTRFLAMCRLRMVTAGNARES